ncbi:MULTISPECIES: hypothetical protein [Spirulina sp. CCY15215]|uniref:hypothetical protein n=1 Tax=Spirulina sp. CCY15215 TaxID=2767591 RepID=UPI00194F3D2E|nr:hypothetical protein [Spirulina major]
MAKSKEFRKLLQQQRPPRKSKAASEPALIEREFTEQQRRIIAIIGTNKSGKIHRVSKDRLIIYRDYLKATLQLPCPAIDTADFDEDENATPQPYHLIAIADDDNLLFGIVAALEHTPTREIATAPLLDLEVPESSVNYQLVEDYKTWYLKYLA